MKQKLNYVVAILGVIILIVALATLTTLHDSRSNHTPHPLSFLISDDHQTMSQNVVPPDGGAIAWQRCLGGSKGECGYSIQQTTDGGYIFAGVTESNERNVSGNHGGADAWVVKLNADGTIAWQQCYGGSNRDTARDIHQTSDGGYIFVGSTWSNDGDVSGNHNPINNRDIWVVKLDTDGTLIWQRCLGGTRHDTGYSVQQTSDGGYIVGGEVESCDGDLKSHDSDNSSKRRGNSDFWAIKLDPDGTIDWQRCFGGKFRECAYSIQQTSDGGYVMAGFTASRYTASQDGDVNCSHGGPSDAWVVKLDAEGTLTWQRCLGGTSEDYAMCIQQTSDGGYIVGGRTPSAHNDSTNLREVSSQDFWLVKLDNDGTISWEKCFGGMERDELNSIQQTSDGGYIAVGSTRSHMLRIAPNDDDVSGNHGNSDVWLVKTDPDGILSWQRCLGGWSDENAYSVQQTSDGGYIVVGATRSNDGDVSGNFGEPSKNALDLDGNPNDQNNHGAVAISHIWVVKLAPA